MQNQTISIYPPVPTRMVTEMLIFAALAIVPLVFGGPQLLIGTIVNALLAELAIISSSRKYYWAAVVPGTAAVIHGVLFGAFTQFLVYLLPIIWLSNWLFMRIWRLKVNGVIKIGVAAVIKTTILWGAAWVFFQLKIIPPSVMVAMGAIQLVTAMLGGIMAAVLTYERS